MAISVIISTYSSPEWLETVVWGYQNQTFKDFELLIANQTLLPETRTLTEKLKAENPFPVRHVSLERGDLSRGTILNKAIQECDSDYVVISDGDCLPRADFLYAHASLRQSGRFIAGDACRLPEATGRAITREDVATQMAFEPNWLGEHGMDHIPSALATSGFFPWIMNTLAKGRAVWNGHNSSAWRRDLLAVNGYDEDMRREAPDRELGERLVNLGIRPIQAKHRAICVRLGHALERPDPAPETIKTNHAILGETRRTGRSWTENGIVKGPAPKIV